MSSVIYYFSGTGNSLAAAKTIAKELKNTTVISMRNNPKDVPVKKAEYVGFIYPTYFQDMPNHVKEFIEQLEIGEAKYIFAIPTCGTLLMVGNSIVHLNKILSKKGKSLSYSKPVVGVANYIAAYPLYQDVDKVYQKSLISLKKIVLDLKNELC